MHGSEVLQCVPQALAWRGTSDPEQVPRLAVQSKGSVSRAGSAMAVRELLGKQLVGNARSLVAEILALWP